MKYIVDKDNVACRILDGEAVMINRKTSVYYSLNNTGTYIWTLLSDHAQSVERIIEDTAARYHKNEKDISADIKDLLKNLAREGFIKKEINNA